MGLIVFIVSVVILPFLTPQKTTEFLSDLVIRITVLVVYGCWCDKIEIRVHFSGIYVIRYASWVVHLNTPGFCVNVDAMI